MKAETALLPKWLLLKDHRRAANSLPLEVDSHLDAVSDSDEGNAAVHPVVLTVEGHRPFNRAGPGAAAGNRQGQLFGFGHPADGKVAVQLEGVAAGLDNLG
jgi:hypothetical protein